MKDLRSTLLVLMFALLAGCSSTPSKPTPTPDGLTESGTITIREKHVMRIAAGTAGEGTLIFQGWQHAFTFEDAKINVVGKDEVEVEGTVYNLEKIEDFEGTYKPAKALFGAGEGLEGIWARNEKDVVVRLNLTGQDVEINMEATGAKITLK